MFATIFKLSVILGALVLPPLALAQEPPATSPGVEELLQNIILFINEVVIPFILGIGFLYFVWGIFRYFIMGGADPESVEKGKNVVIYSLVGFITIFIFWGVVVLLAESTGLVLPVLDSSFIPSLPSLQ